MVNYSVIDKPVIFCRDKPLINIKCNTETKSPSTYRCTACESNYRYIRIHLILVDRTSDRSIGLGCPVRPTQIRIITPGPDVVPSSRRRDLITPQKVGGSDMEDPRQNSLKKIK
jgi:hypothetical protein